MKRLLDYLWLRWHGYCPKHLTGMDTFKGDFYCKECLQEGIAARNAKLQQIREQA